MNQQQFLACLCHGAMMHALPRNKNALKKLNDAQIMAKVKPWLGKVPPQSEKALDNWVASSINPQATQANQLADLSELAELDGLGKKLKKLAKKVVAPIKKVYKKLEDSKIVKKIARPLAYAVGAVTGTVSLVAAADKARNAAISAKNESKINAQIYDAQQAQITEAFAPQQPPQAAMYNPSYSQPQNLAPQQPQNGQVQRLAQEEERPKVVGLSAQGIIDNIKANPLPWGVGAAALVFLLTRNNNQPQYIYREPR